MAHTAKRNRNVRRRVAHLYALLTGVLALVLLVWLFSRQAEDIDLATLLAFTLTALVVSYLYIPVGSAGDRLSLDGAVLLGATLVGGPALGGWAAFATGLVTSFYLLAQDSTADRWADSVSKALLNGGRNVIASVCAWWAFRGLGGGPPGTPFSTTVGLPILVLCITYALLRCLWAWPFSWLRGSTEAQQAGPLAAQKLLLELAPLLAAPLTAAVFLELGWFFYLLLAYVYIGFGALARQMLNTQEEMRAQTEALRLTTRIQEAIGDTQPNVSDLCGLAYQLCEEVVHAPRFELGLFDSALLNVHIQVSVNEGTSLPPMHIPLTPQWEWLSMECQDPRLVLGSEQLSQLPFALPPIGKDQSPEAAMFVPLVPPTPTGQDGPDTAIPPSDPFGAIVLLAPSPNAFTSQDLRDVAEVAKHVARALVCVVPPLTPVDRARPQGEKQTGHVP